MTITMLSLTPIAPPKTETELLDRCAAIAGMTFQQLANELQTFFPEQMRHRKGWVGQAIELALGGQAGSAALPDFISLGIELKTLPLKSPGKPAESTFVTSISMLEAHKEKWDNSSCWKKLKRVLWVPVEGARSIPYEERRIGLGFLWSPSENDYAFLKEDWQEHMDKIACGAWEEIHSGMGTYLQVRPKAAHGKVLCSAYDAEGNIIDTLPRGFYLRAMFTEKILSSG